MILDVFTLVYGASDIGCCDLVNACHKRFASTSDQTDRCSLLGVRPITSGEVYRMIPGLFKFKA